MDTIEKVYDITILPPLSIYNALPFNINFKVNNKQIEPLKKREEKYIYSSKSTDQITVEISFEHFRNSSFTFIAQNKVQEII